MTATIKVNLLAALRHIDLIRQERCALQIYGGPDPELLREAEERLRAMLERER